MVIEKIRHLLDEEAIILDGLDEAAMGHTQDGLLVYKKLMNFWDGVVLKRMSLLKKLM